MSMFVNISEEIRAMLVKQMVDDGCDSAGAREIIDLAAHAVDEAIETVKTVCQRASEPHVMLSAHPLALALLAEAAKVHAQVAEIAALRIADALGLTAVTASSEGKE